MKKSDLKSGMVVEYRCGDKRLVVKDDLIGIDGSVSLSIFNDDLKHNADFKYKKTSVIDIIKVYEYKYFRNFHSLLEYNNLDLIWEREEIKLTEKEVEVLKVLSLLGYEWLARDEDNELFTYTYKPEKRSDYWSHPRCWFLKKAKNLFNFIKWEDVEPTNIDDLLKELEDNE